jgi:hypothetical protein
MHAAPRPPVGPGLIAFRIRTALLAVIIISAAQAVMAQTPGAATQELQGAVAPGMTVWITDSAGREQKTRIVDVSGGVLTAAAGEEIRRFRTSEIVRVRVRHSDPVLNGALIGAGAAVASGLLMCRAMEPWEVCRNDIGPMAKIGALGAGVGIAIDAVVRGRRTIYQAPPGSVRLQVMPLLTRQAGGLQLAITF